MNNGERSKEKVNEIEPGFKVCGVRFRIKDTMSKKECKDLLKDLINDVEVEVDVRTALREANIIEEETKSGISEPLTFLLMVTRQEKSGR